MARKKIWFKAKRYGWGWYPASWQGWACVGGYAVAIAASVWLIASCGEASALALGGGFFLGIGASIALMAVSWRRGETPRWRWGDEDNER